MSWGKQFVSPRDWRARIRDILEAISEINSFTHGMDFTSFKEDAKSIRAVEMNFIIIGEAANQIPEEIFVFLSSLSLSCPRVSLYTYPYAFHPPHPARPPRA